MTYRDDLGAAVARADSLQREVDELRARAGADEEQIRALSRELKEANAEIGNLRRLVPSDRYATRRTPLMGAVVVISICSVAGAFMSRHDATRTAPALVAPTVWAAPPPPAPASTSAALSVTSAPADARILLDGAYIGTTPAKVDVAHGGHQVVVTLGDRVQGQHLDVADDTELTVDFGQVSTYEVRTALDGVERRLAACAGPDWAGGQLDVSFEIRPDGSVAGASAEGSPRPARCLERIVRATHFPQAPNPTRVVFPVVVP